jgi:hypothetical protein
VVSFTLPPLYPGGKSPLYPLNRRPQDRKMKKMIRKIFKQKNGYQQEAN